MNVEDVLYKTMLPYTQQEEVVKYFPNSRVPVYFLLDYIADGLTIDDFWVNYPWIERQDIVKEVKKLRKILREGG